MYLHGELVSGVGSTIDDVEGGHGHDHVLHSGQVGDVTVKWNTLNNN